MDFELMASMMCADYGHLEKEVKELEAGGIDSFHIDIMDGHYAPNYAMSLNDLRFIQRQSTIPPRLCRKLLTLGLFRGLPLTQGHA